MNHCITRLVEACRQRAWLVIAGFTLLMIASLMLAWQRLSIDTNTDHLFAASLPWRQQQLRLERKFPQLKNVLAVVVRGVSPEETDETAARLLAAMRADPAHFHQPRRPDVSTLFQRDGLLLLPSDELDKVLNTLVNTQPLLGPLASDPTARGLLHGIDLMVYGVHVEHADLHPYYGSLQRLANNLQQAAAGHPEPLSWQTLLGSDLAQQPDNIRFVLVHPELDNGSLQPGQATTDALRRIIAELPEVAAGRVRVEYTGPTALADHQFATLTEGMLSSTLVSLALLTLWLFLALKSWRLIIPILLTLICGLTLTLGFAAISIGRLNLVSVAFAVLFVGLAVDFSIQFAVRLREASLQHRLLNEALAATARRSGSQISVAAIAIACGFLAFVPTAFLGIAELGLIAGVGMLLALFTTLTLLPAVLWLLQPHAEAQAIALPVGNRFDRGLHRHRRWLLLLSVTLAALGLGSALTLPFDANPLHTQDPDSEPMRTLRSLADNPTTNPFNIDILVPDLQQARALSARLEKLPEVAQVISGASFIPNAQDDKLVQIDQAQALLLPALGIAPEQASPSATELRAAIADTRQQIAEARPQLPIDSPLLSIDQALARLATVSDAQLLTAERDLVHFLPQQLQALQQALDARPITYQNLPHEIKQDWFTARGEVHIQVSPTSSAQNSEGLHRFVQAVQRIAPDAGGPAVTIVTAADTILHAFQQAAVLASVAIALVLWLVLRRWRDTGYVLLTLLFSSLLTVLLTRLGGISINYANIIALPLLLGVGVSFNVYFVMNWRAGLPGFLGTATARAVLFSALTTGTAFGSLSLSHDPGTASMGRVLLLSLLAVLLATFMFLPALLYSIKREK